MSTKQYNIREKEKGLGIMDKEIIENQETESETIVETDFCMGCGDEFLLDELDEGLCRMCKRVEKREQHSKKTSQSRREYRYE